MHHYSDERVEPVVVTATTLLWAGILFSVPMFLGYGRGEIGLLFFILSSIVILIGKSKTRKLVPENNVQYSAFVSGFICIISNILLAVAISSDNSLSIAFTYAAVGIASCFASMLCVGVSGATVLFVTKWILRTIVVTGVITSALLILGVDINSLTLATIDVSDRTVGFTVPILLPGGTNPFWMTTDYGVFYRATFWCIEPGVAIFLIYIWRFIDSAGHSFGERLKDGIFVAALLATLSTSAPIAMGLYFISRRYERVQSGSVIWSSLAALILALIVVYLFLYLPAFGYAEKVFTHGESFDSRLRWYLEYEDAGTRIALIALVASHLAITVLISGQRVLLLSPIILMVCILNVLEFTALYFFIVIFACSKFFVKKPSSEEMSSNSSDASRRTGLRTIGELTSR